MVLFFYLFVLYFVIVFLGEFILVVGFCYFHSFLFSDWLNMSYFEWLEVPRLAGVMLRA